MLVSMAQLCGMSKQALGSEVRVAYHAGKRELTVHFYSDDQLKAFANLLGQYSVE